MKNDPWRIFGIRHHGPGSARSLRRAFDAWRPDCVLIEGPPDADALIPLAAQEGMEPPVALLVHVEADPLQSSFWPFARFSPEWQAMLWALENGVAVRFCDLPFSHRPEPEASQETSPEAESPEPEEGCEEEPGASESGEGDDDGDGQNLSEIVRDPLGTLARLAGEDDGEAWWNRVVEERGGPEVFEAVLEAMRELRRDQSPEALDPQEARREAWMRQTLREAVKEGRERIAVVCGAWHAPALETLPPARHDAALLKALRKRKTLASWVPWTHDRLSMRSGYGAGVASPGWYDHLWQEHPQASTRWLVSAAGALRERGIDASSASVIESVRLADTLANLRGRAVPDRADLDEAMLSVLCNGDRVVHGLVRSSLEIGQKQGTLCPEAPRTPLQADLEGRQKRLRMPPEAIERELDLDLRKENDRERSVLLRRLRILEIPWGRPLERRDRNSTFHERWQLQWRPEFAVALVDAARLGSTVPVAAKERLVRPDSRRDLPELVRLLEEAILADLPDAVEILCREVRSAAALSDDVLVLLRAIAPLAALARYGDVRATDRELVSPVVHELLVRATLGLGPGCRGIDDDLARDLATAVEQVHAAVTQGKDADPSEWLEGLDKLAHDDAAHGLTAGRACRLLLDGGRTDPEEARCLLGLAIAPGTEPGAGARWIEGFLRDGMSLLLHDDRLRELVDDWMGSLDEERFLESLPLLRRAFSQGSPGERARILARLSRPAGGMTAVTASSLDEERALGILPAILELLGRNP